MTTAALGDRFGRRLMLAAGLGLFVLASAACALAPTIGWLIAARAAQGIGAALIMTLAFALVTTAFAPERRARARHERCPRSRVGTCAREPRGLGQPRGRRHARRRSGASGCVRGAAGLSLLGALAGTALPARLNTPANVPPAATPALHSEGGS